MLSRRSCIAAAGAGWLGAQGAVLGQGEYRYRVAPGWGVLDEKTPVKNCHGLVRDGEGHIILLTDHVANNVIVYDKRGRLVSKWGTAFPGAHGLSIVREGAREVLFLTDLVTHKVVKTTLDGTVLAEWGWPAFGGQYKQEAEYKPSWTLHLADGGFFVLDGYGKDYILRYDAAGKLARVLGGAEGGIVHWGPHGGMLDRGDAVDCDERSAIPASAVAGRGEAGAGGFAGRKWRQIRLHKGKYFVAHLADNWPKDRDSRGFVSVLDSELRVISNVAGSAPEYGDDGKLRAMRHVEDVFLHPHDLVVDEDDSLYVAQFASGGRYPIKLERV